jgi:Family of unknown function (DUF6444)
MPHPEQPSYGELAARNAELTARVAELLAVAAEQAALIETLRAEVAALRRQAGRDSSNSSQPPSQDSPAAKATAKAARQAARRGRPARPQGGRKGHPGASLTWTARPFRIATITGYLADMDSLLAQRRFAGYRKAGELREQIQVFTAAACPAAPAAALGLEGR